MPRTRRMAAAALGVVLAAAAAGSGTAQQQSQLPGECKSLMTDSYSTTFADASDGFWVATGSYLNDMTSDCGTGASFCTWADPSLAQFGAPLPGGGTGLALTLSQEPCGHQGCCQNGVCANWAGAHLASAACFLYGTVEFEASISGFPAATNGVFYVGTRVTAPNQNLQDAQNEIDIGMAPSTLQPLPSPSGQQHANDVAVAGSGPELVLAYFGPSLSAESYDQSSTPQFTQAQANAFTTYKFVWGPGSLDYYVDGQLFRSVRTQAGAPSALRDMNVPWRPQDLRLIVRTNVGTSQQAPAGTVYMRSLTVTPAGAQPGAQAAPAPQQAPQQQAQPRQAVPAPQQPPTPHAPRSSPPPHAPPRRESPPPRSPPPHSLPPDAPVVVVQPQAAEETQPQPAEATPAASAQQQSLQAQAQAQANALATSQQQCLQLCQAQQIPAQAQACTSQCAAQYAMLMGQINPALLAGSQQPAAVPQPVPAPQQPPTPVAVAAQPQQTQPQVTQAQVEQTLESQAQAQANALATAEQQCLQLCQAQQVPAQEQACTSQCTAQYAMLMGQINPALLAPAQAAPAVQPAATPDVTMAAVAVTVAVAPVAAPLAAPDVVPVQLWEAVPTPQTVAPRVLPTPAPPATTPAQYWEAVPSPPPRKVLAPAPPADTEVAAVAVSASTAAAAAIAAPQAAETPASVEARTGPMARFMLRPLRR